MTKTLVNKKVISNKSRTYCLPLLSKDMDIEFDYLLINTYLKFNKDIGDISYPIGLFYNLEDTNSFNEYNDYLTHNNLYYTSFLIDNNKKLYIFNFPEKFINEYKLFKEGRYSKFSSEAKSLIISYSAEKYKYPPLIEDITGVLWKHKTRRERLEKDLGVNLPEDSELASKIVYERETFNFDING
jgi:hypothetical protein